DARRQRPTGGLSGYEQLRVVRSGRCPRERSFEPESWPAVSVQRSGVHNGWAGIQLGSATFSKGGTSTPGYPVRTRRPRQHPFRHSAGARSNEAVSKHASRPSELAWFFAARGFRVASDEVQTKYGPPRRLRLVLVRGDRDLFDRRNSAATVLRVGRGR